MTIVEVSVYDLLHGQRTSIRLNDGLVEKGLKKGLLIPGKLVSVKFDHIELISPFTFHVVQTCTEKGISVCVISYDSECESLHTFAAKLSAWTPTRLLLLLTSKDGHINLIKRKLDSFLEHILETGNTCVLSNLDMLDQLPEQGIIVSEDYTNPGNFCINPAKFKTTGDAFLHRN